MRESVNKVHLMTWMSIHLKCNANDGLEGNDVLWTVGGSKSLPGCCLPASLTRGSTVCSNALFGCCTCNWLSLAAAFPIIVLIFICNMRVYNIFLM